MKKGSTLSKTMLQAIVQTDHVGSADALTTYPESVRDEAARYFRTLADRLAPPAAPAGLEIACPHCGETITEKDVSGGA